MISKVLLSYDLGKRGRHFRWQEEGRKEEERAARQRRRRCSASLRWQPRLRPSALPGPLAFRWVQETSRGSGQVAEPPERGGWHTGWDPPRPWGCRPAHAGGGDSGEVPARHAPCLTPVLRRHAPSRLSISTPFGGPNLCQPTWPPSPSPARP